MHSRHINDTSESEAGTLKLPTYLRPRSPHGAEARCKWFAYGPADATATRLSLASLKSSLV